MSQYFDSSVIFQVIAVFWNLRVSILFCPVIIQKKMNVYELS